MKKIILLALAVIFAETLQAQTFNDSLLLYLPFNGNANDASSNGNNGVVNNAALTTDRFGTSNSAYDFNGTDAYIEIPASASLSKVYTSNEVTIAAWINIRNWYQGWNVFAVFEQYDSLTDFGSLLLEANWDAGGILFTSGYNANYIGCDYTWNFNEWHHIAVTYSNITDSAKFYIDGNLLCSKEYHEVFTLDNANPYVIGRSLSGPDEYSDGMIDELRIYNRALKESELTALPDDTTTTPPVTKVNGLQLQPLKIFPNPANEKIYCKADKPFHNAQLIVSDVMGKEMLQANNISGYQLELDVHSLAIGLYLLRITDGDKQFSEKFLRQ